MLDSGPQRVRLRHGSTAFAMLREPCGADELSVFGVDTEAAIALLARLLEGADAAPRSLALGAAERDALLAALHRRCFGDLIVSSLRCAACGSLFDLSFALSDLQRELATQGAAWVAERCADADWQAPEAPSGSDELLAAECLRRGEPARALEVLAGGREPEALAEALDHAAPILDLEMDARCAECGHLQPVHLDVQRFVLQRLIDQRARIIDEAGAIAEAYHWSPHEILGLPRSLRRSFAERLGQGSA